MDGMNSAVVVQSIFSVASLPKVLQELFLTQPTEVAQCVQREREFDGPTLVQTFVFGYLHQPDAGSTDLAQTASQCGVQVTPSAIDQWLDKPQTATFFKDLIVKAAQYVVAAEPVDVELLKRFQAVHLLDSTTIALPDELAHLWSGCGTDSPQGGKAALKIQARLDVLTGALLIDLTPGRECDQKAEIKTKDLQAGELHIRDLGYFDLDALEKITQSDGYFVSRMMHGTVVFDREGNRLNLLEFLRDASGDVDMWVLVGRGKKLKMRLLARRLPDWVAESRRRKCRQKVKDKGRTATEEQLELRSWTIIVTNVPEEALKLPAAEEDSAEKPAAPGLTMDEAIALMRQRWQIELLFKLWKSQGKLARTRRQKAQRILCEVYAKVLAMIVQHWVLLHAAWEFADRSLTQASKAVRKGALELLRHLNDLLKLKEELDRIAQMVGKTSRIHRRKKKPAAFQVMNDPTLFGYERCA
jgi:DDE family transposase